MNIKLSKSLKRYHKTKKSRKDIKVLIGFILTVVFASQIWLLIKPISTSSAMTEYILSFPVNRDKEKLTVADRILITAKQEGFTDTNYLLKLAYCESRLDEFALNGNGGHSIDRGAFQINSLYHSEVKSDCAFNVECATKWTIKMLNNNRHHEWMCSKYIK